MSAGHNSTFKSKSINSGEVLIVSELYYPEETSTGHVMTTMAEGIAQTHSVTVICAQPSYSGRGIRSERSEYHNGVAIKRVRSTTFDPHLPHLRALNFITVSVSSFWTAVRFLRRNHHVLVVTNPPLLPALIVAAAKLRGATCSVVVHDLYPEVLVPGQILKSESRTYRLIERFMARVFQSADQVISVGRDQRSAIERKLSHSDTEVLVIRQAADLESIQNQTQKGNRYLVDLGLDSSEKLVIQFAGNIGPLQNIDQIIRLMAAVAHLEDVHFIFFGSGRSEETLTTAISSLQLRNVAVLGPVPRSGASEMHAACDLAIVSLVRGMVGVSVPSRIGNILASGRPILGLVEEGSELQQLISESGCGYWIEPDDVEGFVKLITTLSDEKQAVRAKQVSCRQLAETHFGLPNMTSKYVEAIELVRAKRSSR